ncbi:MAG: formylglycine-generating enzyme family protein [Planctomycetota bacterium]
MIRRAHRPFLAAGLLLGLTSFSLAGTIGLSKVQVAGKGVGNTEETVTVREALVCKTEVTNDRFAQFVQATGHETLAEELGFGAIDFEIVEGADWLHPEGPGSDIDGKGDHPVFFVAWDDAVAWCDWAGMRLPTEAEFERWMRNGFEDKRWPWGGTLSFDADAPLNYGNFNEALADVPNWTYKGDPFDRAPGPVASFAADTFGLHDVAGNAEEWCHDWYDADYYEVSPQFDPQGPASGSQRCVRGGSWDSWQPHYETFLRRKEPAPQRNEWLGFRGVFDLPERP